MGFLYYEETQYPFEFDEKSFTVTLYPPTYQIWQENSDPVRFFQDFYKRMKKVVFHTQIEIKGKTSDNNNVVFGVYNVSGNDCGFRTFEVNWYLYYTPKLDLDKIEGFQAIGHDVNLFYPPKRALTTKIEYNENENIGKFSISSQNNQPIESCGKYRVHKHVDAIIELTSNASLCQDNWISSIDANSCMKTTFSSPVDNKVLIKAYCNLRLFFGYITYRQNIDLGDIEVLTKNEDGLQSCEGILVFPEKFPREVDPKSKERIIQYCFLKNKIGKLFTALKNKRIGLSHLSKSFNEQQSYSAARFIMILVEFERIFRYVYGQDFDRSIEYLDVKREVVLLIDNYCQSCKGKKKKYAKTLKTYLEKRDNSFADNLGSALLNHKKIMSCFINVHQYGENYTKSIEDISSRMGEVRNAIAHGRLDIKYDANHLTDMWIMERLLYCLCLKDILHIEDQDCINAITKLFGG